MSDLSVAIALAPGEPKQVTIRLLGYAGPERFGKFRESIAGASFDRALGVNLAPVNTLATITKRLRESDFGVDVSPEARRALQEFSASQMFDLQRVRERIEQIDESIRDRSEKAGKKLELYVFQKTGAEWLTLRRTALLADQMGLGKTATIITAIPPNVPIVAVVPARLKGNWAVEVGIWRPTITTAILSGRNSFRWPRPGEMVITSHEILPDIHGGKLASGRTCEGFLDPEPCSGCASEVIFSATIQTRIVPGKHKGGCEGSQAPRECPGCNPLLASAPEGTVLLTDEAHLLKKGKSLRTKRFRALGKAVLDKGGKTWGATGTPLENTPMDLWHVYRSLNLTSEAFGSFREFTALFQGETEVVSRSGVKALTWKKLTAQDSEKIKPLLQRVSLRRLRAEVLPQLPTKVYRDLLVEIDRKTLGECERFLKDVGGIDRAMELIAKDEGKGIELLPTLRRIIASAKIPAMLDFIEPFEEEGEPLVVFSAHRAPIEVLAQRDGWEVIMGGSDKDVAGIQRRFQAGELKGIGMTLSGGVGLTLTRANQMLQVDQDWRPTMDDQITDRLVRIGQERGVVITTLVLDHAIEKRVRELHVKKRDLVEASVDVARSTSDMQTRIEEEIAAIQKEAANGRAIRRTAKNSEEESLLKALANKLFAEASDERLAAALLEEARAIGLSEAQWSLALRVSTRP